MDYAMDDTLPPYIETYHQPGLGNISPNPAAAVDLAYAKMPYCSNPIPISLRSGLGAE